MAWLAAAVKPYIAVNACVIANTYTLLGETVQIAKVQNSYVIASFEARRID
jgi:hypothetical protein